MPNKALGAAKLALLIDEAFDSMNGTCEKNYEKPMLNLVKNDSGLDKFRSETRGKFLKLCFVTKKEKRLLTLQA